MSTNPTEKTATPQPGDIWQEQDPRQPRFVRVTKVSGGSVGIYAVEKDVSGDWRVSRNPRTGRPAPERLAQSQRFNGKRGGYALHDRPKS